MHFLILAIVVAPVQQQDTARAPVPLPGIVVTATRSPLDPMDSPLPATTLDSTALRRDSRYSIARVVAQTPGVHALTTGEQIGKPVIRGLSGARVLVLEDGHRLEDYSWSDEDGPSIDPALANRIEIIRGPASLLYGSDAIGGVVNAIPEPLPSATLGQRVLRWPVGLGASTNNPGGGGDAGVEYASGIFGLRAHVVARMAGSIGTPDGEIENTGFSAFSGDLAAGWRSGTTGLTLRFSQMGGEFKLLEANGPPTPPPPGTEEKGPERKLSDSRFQLTAESMWHGLRMELRGQVQSHGIIELSDDATQPGVESETFNLATLTTSIDVLAHHHIGKAEGTFGVNGLLSSNDTRGLVPLVPDANSTGAAVFIIERLPLSPRFSVLAGVRADVLHLEADSNATLALGAQARDFNSVSGDLGVVAQVAPGFALAVNAGRAFRAPNLFELFSNGERLGEARYEIGDPTMNPEVGFNVDASLRWRKSRIRGEIAVFRNHIDDFIFITPTSQFFQTGTPATPDSVRIFMYGQANATLTGGEASLAVDVSPMVTLGAKFDAVKGDNDSLNQPLPLIPPPRGVFEFQLHARPGSAKRWYAGLDVEGNAEQTRLAQYNVPGQGYQASDIATAGYVLLGLDGGLVARLGSRRFTIDARVRNLANTSYRDYLNRYKEFALDAGRSISVRFGTEF